MLIQPDDLEDNLIASHLRVAWHLDVDSVEYAPVGFGSHHWHVSANDKRWFATVDDLRMGERDGATLDAALMTAHGLRGAGLDFVVAAVPTDDARITVALEGTRLDEHYVLSLFRHVVGASSLHGAYASISERREVIERLVKVHAATPGVRQIAPIDAMTVPCRARLVAAMASPSTDWSGGPYAGQAHNVLRRHAEAISDALVHYDELATAAMRTSDRFVVTHGEPHRANTMRTPDGVVLIDWETCRLAPPERDLWALVDEDAESAHLYSELGGVALDGEAMALYRLWWDLCEVALYTHDLQRDHDDTAETRIAWQGLQQHATQIAERYPRAGGTG